MLVAATPAGWGRPTLLVYRGSDEGLRAQPTTEWLLDPPGLRLAAVPGDVDGDGMADAIVGYASADEAVRDVRLHFGGPWGLGPAVAAIPAPADPQGPAARPAGDVDGDGLGDVVVTGLAGDWWADLFYGAGRELDPEFAGLVDADAARAEFGRSAPRRGGDFDGDGYEDMIDVSAYRVSVYGGGPDRRAPEQTGFTDDACDAFVTRVGDVDGDSFADLVVHDPYCTPDWMYGSTVYLYVGSPDGLQRHPSQALEPGEDARGSDADLVAPAGDVDGDGLADLLVGWSAGEGPPGRLAAYRAYADLDRDGYPSTEDCDDLDYDVNPSAIDTGFDGLDRDCTGPERYPGPGECGPLYVAGQECGGGQAVAPGALLLAAGLARRRVRRPPPTPTIPARSPASPAPSPAPSRPPAPGPGARPRVRRPWKRGRR